MSHTTSSEETYQPDNGGIFNGLATRTAAIQYWSIQLEKFLNYGVSQRCNLQSYDIDRLPLK